MAIYVHVHVLYDIAVFKPHCKIYKGHAQANDWSCSMPQSVIHCRKCLRLYGYSNYLFVTQLANDG